MTDDTFDRGSGPEVCVALDVPDGQRVRDLYRVLRPHTDYFKVGPPLLMAAGPGIVREMADDGARIFLDLKFHDIPQTVESSARQAARLRPYVFDVHALAGDEAMSRAVEAAHETADGNRPLVIAITMLVSHQERYLADYFGSPEKIEEAVLRLAERARANGLDGVVCSPEEGPLVRAEFGPDFFVVTPGVRFASDQADDHSPQRIATFDEPRLSSSSLLVAGRPIIDAADPVEALCRAQQLLHGKA
ncbi:orotidine 5'-phosphate decarboxylase [Amycolatopsis orientalis]|uniref:Orotidine 5'-phosphate decarboxylase n=1 Tax=Amycolatopsis orientalis TaxID=31958 RepID=A0A193BUY1_AMYOR|nr:orotidine-5'-phosphate decarboxylase [Amycolatopsis orientalis]ANN16026.1 orotidine 5'-phosphate decarboxylase [Amycolatopsis orientalis]